MTQEIKFEIGEKYENMKGTFEVVAVHRNSMDIRWADGEEVSTPIDLQQRIIERMRFEKELERAQKAQKAKKTSVSKGAKHFAGLDVSDFGDRVAKTTWRGRGQLGGAVAGLLKSKTFKFNSWAVLRKPEVNWLDIGRQKQDDLKQQAKFYARVEANHLYFGIQIPVSDPDGTDRHDGQMLLSWLEKPENDAWLNKQCTAHQLVVRDLTRMGFSGLLEPATDGWAYRGDPADKPVAVESLRLFLADAGQSDAMDLRIETCLEKEA
ncbi:MAG: hypothetical protein WBY88_14445, partial [Desulfosarcina sp.]